MRNPPDFTGSDEESVVAMAKIGNHQAFEELVRRRQSWLRNLMRRLSGDADLADDLAQQVFFSAWRNLRHLKTNRAFGAWLKRTAVNAWLDHLRSTDPLNALNADSEGEMEVPARPPVGSQAVRIDLDRALATLSPPVRLCIVLAYSEGMSHGAISETTGLPLGTVKSHIRRGLGRLRTFWEPKERTLSGGNR